MALKALLWSSMAATLALLGISFASEPAEKKKEEAKTFTQPLKETKAMLLQKAPSLSPKAMDSLLLALSCAKQNEMKHNHILTVIDYSLPSSKKRLWVFDTDNEQLLFHTYVSHGLKSGVTSPTYFSNIVNGKTSSVGVFSTENAYTGRYGAALKLQGLDKKFNDNAYKRFIVMHGSWYVNEDFIKKYGRAGRSWGCPTVSLDVVENLVDTIKDNAFLFVYYPDNRWLSESKFLNCKGTPNKMVVIEKENKHSEERMPIIFADINNNNKLEKTEPVVVMRVDDYKRIVNKKIPLNRMLRRQINKAEFIALTNDELKNLSAKQIKNSINLVIPVVKLKKGYYATEMKIVDYGKTKNINLNSTSHQISYEKKSSVSLKPSNRFIRWLGL